MPYNERRELTLPPQTAHFGDAHGAKGQLAQLKPEPQPPPPLAEPPNGEPAAGTPQAPGTEKSFSTSEDPQFGHWGGGAVLGAKMSFSYLTPQALHRYS